MWLPPRLKTPGQCVLAWVPTTRPSLSKMVVTCYACEAQCGKSVERDRSAPLLRRRDSLVEDDIEDGPRGPRTKFIYFCDKCDKKGEPERLCLPDLDERVMQEWNSFVRVRAELTDLRRIFGSTELALTHQRDRLSGETSYMLKLDWETHKRLRYLYENVKDGRSNQVYDPFFRDITSDLACTNLRNAIVADPANMVDCAANYFFQLFAYMARLNRSSMLAIPKIWRAPDALSAGAEGQKVEAASITSRGNVGLERLSEELVALRGFFQNRSRSEGCSGEFRQTARRFIRSKHSS